MRESNVKIVVGKDENIEKALRRFKKLCERAGIKKELKARQYYEKPSETRRKAIRKAEKNRYKDSHPSSSRDEYSKNSKGRDSSKFDRDSDHQDN